MPQLTKGARKALDQIAADATDIRNDLALARDRAKFNPDFARDKIAAALAALARLEATIADDITPLLERQAPEYERRLLELEQRIQRLEADAPTLRTVRRDAAGGR